MFVLLINTAYAYTMRIYLWSKTVEIVGVTSHTLLGNNLVVTSFGLIKRTTVFNLNDISYYEIIDN
jgi:hypothetical protein